MSVPFLAACFFLPAAFEGSSVRWADAPDDRGVRLLDAARRSAPAPVPEHAVVSVVSSAAMPTIDLPDFFVNFDSL